VKPVKTGASAGFNDGQGSEGPSAKVVVKFGGTLEEVGVEVETSPGYASRPGGDGGGETSGGMQQLAWRDHRR
jgi:hypothetical protein